MHYLEQTLKQIFERGQIIVIAVFFSATKHLKQKKII